MFIKLIWHNYDNTFFMIYQYFFKKNCPLQSGSSEIAESYDKRQKRNQSLLPFKITVLNSTQHKSVLFTYIFFANEYSVAVAVLRQPFRDVYFLASPDLLRKIKYGNSCFVYISDNRSSNFLNSYLYVIMKNTHVIIHVIGSVRATPKNPKALVIWVATT